MDIIFILVSLIALIYCCHFYLNFRLYKLWWQLPRAFTIPFFGSIWFLMKISKDITNICHNTLDIYDSRMSYWIGQDLIVLSGKRSDWEKIVKSPDALNKAMVYKKFEIITKQGLPIARADVWKPNRKILLQGFTKSSLDSCVDDLFKISEKFVQNLKNNFKPNDDILLHMYDYTMNGFIDSFLGVDGEIANKKYRWGEIISKFNDLLFLQISHPVYGVGFIFDKTERGREFAKNLVKIKEFLSILTKESDRIPEHEDPKKAARHQTLLFNRLKDTSILSRVQYEEELLSFILAGTDTTSLTMSFVVVLLGLFNDMQEGIYREILNVMGERKEITNQDLVEFKYLERFIYETLRLFPISSIMGRRLDADIDLGDVTLPAGTNFLVFVYNIHRNPKYYPDPLRFDPDRFLPEECATRNPYTFLAFSHGVRNCIGLKYAMLELKMGLANLIRNFRVTTNYKSIEEMEIATKLFNKLKNGFNCTLHSRF